MVFKIFKIYGEAKIKLKAGNGNFLILLNLFKFVVTRFLQLCICLHYSILYGLNFYLFAIPILEYTLCFKKYTLSLSGFELHGL